MSEFPELRSLRMEMDEGTAELQREQIRRAIDETPRRRRWLAGLAAAVVVGLPAAAVAADGAVPGDVLYPVKRAVEPLVALVDRDVVVEHRIEEAEELARRGAEPADVDRAVRDARRAIDEAPPLEVDTDRLDRLTDAPAGDRDPVPSTRPAGDATTTTSTSTSTTVVDRATSTTDRVTSTTVPSRDSTTTVPGDRPRDG